MLDLDPSVQLEEEEVAAVEHELRRPGARVADRLREADRRVAHRGALRGIERRRGRLFEHLLVAPLDRAFALPERDDAPPRIAEKLNLDVPWPFDVALREDAVVAECRLERIGKVGARAHDPDPAPTAAGSRLQQQREAELVRLAALDHRHTRLQRDPLRLELVPAGAQRLGRGPYPDEPGRADRLREVRALREEAVAGVDRVGVRLPRRANLLLRLQVAADVDCLVRFARVQRAAVVGRDDGDGRNAELATRAEDAERDLAAVCYEELADLHSAASVSAHNAASRSYGTASAVTSASAPPPTAPQITAGAHARLIRAKPKA